MESVHWELWSVLYTLRYGVHMPNDTWTNVWAIPNPLNERKVNVTSVMLLV